MKDALAIVTRITVDALCLDGAGPSIEVQCELEVQRRVPKFSGWLNDLIEIHMVVEASEVRKASDRVYSLMLRDLSMEHPANGNAETISARPCLIPRKIVIQGELPSLKICFPAGAPDTIKATCQSYRSFDLTVLWDEHDVGCP